MTSEILIMNKNAIAMAADSAVTVGNSKTYNGVNKLFMLSNDPPMGIMIFGAADFEGIPMETLIKEYRKKTDFNVKQDIITIKDDFLKFLGANTPNSDFESMISAGLKTFESFIVPKISNFDGETLVNFLNSIKCDKLPSFLKSYETIINKYNLAFENMIPDTVDNKYHEKIIADLKNIFLNSLIKMGTGIVISGFSSQDMFPSLIHFNLCVNNNGKIEIIDYNEVLNHNGNGIFPFAQKDVIDTFLTGIDLNLGDTIVAYFDNFLKKYLNELRVELNSNKKIKGKSLPAVNQVLDNFDKTSNKRVNEFAENIVELKEDFNKPIIGSIGALPKEELANMSESLIHITSLKRKVDSNLETVGGDIDVAIITKGDGFIWKKRKHYFDAELNPQFFEREK
ncbi:MAG: hypothetical protein Q4Q14_00700 [Methanobrevibacter sp.]|nr:hypothetical protein [Methanobrevibacter sp.]